MKAKIVPQTMFNYSIVNRATGAEEIIRNVWFTFYHDKVVELHTSETNYTTFPLAEYEVVKRV